MKHAILIILVTTLAACSKEASPPLQQTERSAMTMVVGTLPGESSNLYSGEVRARHEAALGFRIGGKIVERMVDAGAQVKAGQVLMRIDAADAGLQLRAADAQYQLAEADVKRYRELQSKGFVSQSALDAKESAFKAAASQAGLSLNQEHYTTLRADHAGVVATILAEVGQVVSAGQPALRMAQDGEREVAIAIPENQINNIKVGEKAEITLWSANNAGETYKGRLRELAPMADAASRTYAARVTFSGADAKVALGMTAQVRFSNPGKGRDLLVPSSAIFQQGDKDAVWIVAADHSINLRPVQIAAYRDEGVVISGGLDSGERIVIAGVHKLTAGEKIHPMDNDNANAR